MSAQLWAAVTKCRETGWLKQKKFIFTVLEANKSAIREPAWSGSGAVSSWFAHGCYLAVDSHAALGDRGLTSSKNALPLRKTPS